MVPSKTGDLACILADAGLRDPPTASWRPAALRA